VGVIFLDKNEEGPRFNRTLGADMNLRFGRNLNVNSFIVKTFSPGVATAGKLDEISARAGVNWRDNFWDFRALLLTIGEEFDDQMGYIPRTGVNRVEGQFGVHPRPRKLQRWVREFYPHYQIQNVTRTRGGLDSRYDDYHVQISFQNGGYVEPGINTNVEDLIAPFTVNSKRKIGILPGRYDFNEYFVMGSSNSSAPLSINGRFLRRSQELVPGRVERQGQRAAESLLQLVQKRRLSPERRVHDRPDLDEGELQFHDEDVGRRAGAIQHRRPAVEFEHPVQHHPSPAQRLLPGLQRATRRAHERDAESGADCEADLHDGVLTDC